MNLRELIPNLQRKSYRTRLNILWGTVAVLAVILMAVWVTTIQSEIINMNTSGSKDNAPKQEQPNSSFIKVERIESNDAGAFKIYFNINNPTNDIINFSTADNIKLLVNDAKLTPLRILDRQKKTFVSRILSHTQNFGILYFNPTSADFGTLTFSDLFFEKKPDSLFKEEFNLDFQALNKPEQLRK